MRVKELNQIRQISGLWFDKCAQNCDTFCVKYSEIVLGIDVWAVILISSYSLVITCNGYVVGDAVV